MSQIQWTQQTWNPILGCTQIIGSPPALSGCLHCYAMRQAYRNQAMGLRGYEGVVKKTSQGDILWTGKVNLVSRSAPQTPPTPKAYYMVRQLDV